MANKQTAVDWLAEQIKFTNKEMYAELEDEFMHAKAMEKEQIIDAAYNGADSEHSSFDNAEQYYNETYGK